MAMISIPVVATDDIMATDHNTIREDIIRNSGIYAVTAGTSSAYTLSIDSAYTSYIVGDKITCKIHDTNVLGATLNINSIGALAIVGYDGNSILQGILLKNNIADFIYNGTSLIYVGGDINPSMLSYSGGIPTFSDNISMYSEVFFGTTIRLMKSGLIQYKSGTSQSITAATIWASAGSVSSSIIVDGYVYAYLIQTSTSARIYRCSVTADISNSANWVQVTISGATLGFSGNDGLVGHDGTNFYCIHATNGYVQFTLSGTTFTFVANITVTGANYSSLYARVNHLGIFANFSSAPYIRYASHAGALDSIRQLSFGATAVFSTKNALYVSGSVTYILQRVYI